VKPPSRILDSLSLSLSLSLFCLLLSPTSNSVDPAFPLLYTHLLYLLPFSFFFSFFLRARVCVCCLIQPECNSFVLQVNAVDRVQLIFCFFLIFPCLFVFVDVVSPPFQFGLFF
jgi:hypothetical protein